MSEINHEDYKGHEGPRTIHFHKPLDPHFVSFVTFVIKKIASS